MTSLMPYALGLLVALPINARSDLHAREIRADNNEVRQALLDPARGLAMYCGRTIDVGQGVLCEQIRHDDLAEAQARLVLRSAGEALYVDGDFFVPADGRVPALLERGTMGFSKQAARASHEHVCPVVHRPSFGERYVDENGRLCVTVTQLPEPKRYLSDVAQGALNVFAGAMAVLVILAGSTG